MKILINNLIAFVVISLLMSCENKIVYHSYHSIAKDEWCKSDTLSFKVPIADSVSTLLHLFVEIRNKNNYPYRDFSVVVFNNFSDTTVWKADTLTLDLASSDGKWLGTGLGDLFQSSRILKSVVSTHSGNYTIKVLHNMKDDRVNGISDVGIRLEK